VYGRLQNRDLTFTIKTKCANSGKEIQIELDSDLNITGMTEGANPMYLSSSGQKRMQGNFKRKPVNSYFI
jgi:hypothetical protein